MSAERWLVAARLSRLDKRHADAITGIQTQDHRAAEWALAEGHEIIHVTRDRNVSGSVPPWERPELGPWLTEPGKISQYDGIVAYEANRLSRDYADLPGLRKWAEQRGKKLYVIRDRLRWPDDRDGLLWAVAAERAYQERQDIIERTTRELDALREAGKLTGRPAWGYVSVGEKYNHTILPTAEGRKYIPEIFQKVIDGDSLATIAAWLNDEGVRPTASEKWWPRVIGTMIRNATYMGYRTDASGTVILKCEAVVDAATFRRAGEALDARPKRGPTNAANRAMLAAGAIYCPICDDSPMYRITTGAPGNRTPYYRCSGRGAARRGCGNMVRLDAADAAVNAIAERTFAIPVKVTRVIPGHDHSAELEEVRFAMKQLAARDLTDAEYDAELARLRTERDRLSAQPSVPDRVEEVELDQTYAEVWAELPDAERGPWLVKHQFRVTASKEVVSLAQGDVVFGMEYLQLGASATARNRQPDFDGG